MKKNYFFIKYFKEIKNHLQIKKKNDYIKNLIKVSAIIKQKSKNKKKLILVGNGGSSTIASHVSLDLTKNAKIRAVNFNDPSLITCFTNDFGQENWITSALDFYCDKGDIVILISSSGVSRNIVKAGQWCIRNKINLVTFTGRSKSNDLRTLNKKGINFWVNSHSYNHIETIHSILLLSIVDHLIGKSVYEP